MTDDDDAPSGFSLRRWSARKRAAVAAEGATQPIVHGADVDAVAEAVNGDAPAQPQSPVPAERAPVPALPPVESLTPQSDFTPFMQPDVDPALRRAALHKLFADPHFNVMDGLDVYIDDYSKPDPISPEMVRGLLHSRYIFSPPPTQMNEAGYVEDVPAEMIAAAASGEATGATPAAVTSATPVGAADAKTAAAASPIDAAPSPQAELPLEPPPSTAR
jgi:hypothetical protein